MRIHATAAWEALVAHAGALKPRHLRELFAEDPQRFATFSLPLGEVLFDYSKQRVTAETIALLCELAASAGVQRGIERMYAGEAINASENRAALHHAQLTESINNASVPATQALAGLSSTGMSQEQSLFYINRLIDQQAFTLSADDIFAASAAVFLLLIVVIWLAKPSHAHAPADAGGAH